MRGRRAEIVVVQQPEEEQHGDAAIIAETFDDDHAAAAAVAAAAAAAAEGGSLGATLNRMLSVHDLVHDGGDDDSDGTVFSFINVQGWHPCTVVPQASMRAHLYGGHPCTIKFLVTLVRVID